MQVEHHTIRRDGLAWHVATTGNTSAPPLVMLHCWTGNWRMWESTIEALGDRYHYILPDHLGFGGSDKPRGDQYGIGLQAERTRFLLSELGVSRASVIGHSMGGQIALTYAGLYPDQVEKLVVVDPAVTGKLHPLAAAVSGFWMTLVRWGAEGLIEPTIRFASRIRPVAHASSIIYFRHPSRVSDAAVYWAGQLIADHQLHSSAWAHKAILQHDPTPLLSKITAPTLAIWGIDDWCIPVSECGVLERHIPNFTALKIPDIGHMPMIESLEKYREGVVGFLKPAPLP
jgi:pimeloyl-ACP methyl ester carboxylesterase